MKFNQWIWGVITLFFSSMAAANNCGVIGKINEIINKNSDDSVYVVSSGCVAQQRISAYAYQWIYDGDRFEITGDTEVHIALAKGERRVLTQHHSGQILHTQTADDLYDDQNSLSGKFTLAIDVWKKLERQRKSIPFFNKVRGSEQNLTIREDPLSPSGVQLLPANYAQIALLWRGGPATAVLTNAGQTAEFQSGNWAYLLIPVSEIQMEISIRLQEQRIHWQIKTAMKAPTPEGIEESDLSKPLLQLNRAIWILGQQDLMNWRLFALSELARLSHRGIFAAEELWKAALSGELAAALQEI
ncbi:MAG: hypothetical protein LZF61_02675 [Nitrosomonas sp.]|nr:MAG: hypothetical protein LZF61_02675 [Nitrosomonas sp.]